MSCNPIQIYTRIFSEAINELNYLDEEPSVIDCIKLALEKTLNNKKGNLSPAIYPVFIANDLDNSRLDLAYSLSVICAYFHTAADLMDDIQDNAKNNSLLNYVGKAQTSNIANKLIFIFQRLISKLKVDNKKKLELFMLFNQSGDVMTTGQFFDLELTNKIIDEKKLTANDILLMVERKSGSELACFFACFPIATGIISEPYYKMGMTLGSLFQVFSDYTNIWCQTESDDLLELKNNLAIFAASNDSVFKQEVRLMLAGKINSEEKLRTLRRLITRTRALEEFNSYFKLCRDIIEQIFLEFPELKSLKQISNSPYATVIRH